MTVSDVQGETFRGSVHFVAASLVAVMGAYNAMRFAEERDVKHAVYTLIYGGAFLFEARNTWGHWRDAN